MRSAHDWTEDFYNEKFLRPSFTVQPFIERIQQDALSNPPSQCEGVEPFQERMLRFMEKQDANIQRRHNDYMITQQNLDTALKNLTDAVANAASHKPPESVPSTPDNVVQAFVDGVSGQTVALNTAFPATP